MKGSHSGNARHHGEPKETADPLDLMRTMAPGQGADSSEGAGADSLYPKDPAAEAAPVQIITDATRPEPMRLVRGEDLPLRGFTRVHLNNTTDARLTGIVIRAGSLIRDLPDQPPGSTSSLDVPADVARLTASALAGDQRHVCAWALIGRRNEGDQPLIELRGAADLHGGIDIDADGDMAPRVVIRDAGDVHGGIRLRHRRSGGIRQGQPYPLIAWDVAPGFSPELLPVVARRIVLAVAEEVSMGYAPECTWRVFCRDADGQGLAVNGPTGETIVPETNADRADIQFPISRIHATLDWQGTTKVGIEDCSVRYLGHRGVFSRGIRLDEGRHIFELPLSFTLARPESRFHAAFTITAAPCLEGGPLLAAWQTDAPVGELLLWRRGPGCFLLALQASGGLCPVASVLEAAAAARRDRVRGWTIRPLSPEGEDDQPCRRGMRIDLGGANYEAVDVSDDRLILEQANTFSP